MCLSVCLSVSVHLFHGGGGSYLIGTLTESRGEEQSIELLKGLFPWRKVGIRQDLEWGLYREEACLGGDVIVG